jgi:hypothetical protein
VERDLLRDIGMRLFAPTGPWVRARRAKEIVSGTVTRSEIIPHEPSPEFLADAAVAPLALDGPGGLALFLAVVEVTVERRVVGEGGAVSTGVWLSPEEMTSDTVTLPLPDTRGVALFDDLATDTTLGAEMAKAVPGARSLEPIAPLILPDDDGSVIDAVALVGEKEPSPERWATALGATNRLALQLALASAAHAHAIDALRAAAQASPEDGDPTRALLVRAARAAAGDATASEGFSTDQADADALYELGYQVLEAGGRRTAINGPDTETLLPW